MMDKQIEELKSLLDTMVGNSSQLKAEKLYATGYRKVKHGEWLWNRGCAYDEKQYYCSLCAGGSDTGRDKYCPNCGAKMDGGADNG